MGIWYLNLTLALLTMTDIPVFIHIVLPEMVLCQTTQLETRQILFMLIASLSTGIFSLCLLNSRSIRNKSAAIFDYICERKVDMMGITETWVSSYGYAVRSELCPDGYRILDIVEVGYCSIILRFS